MPSPTVTASFTTIQNITADTVDVSEAEATTGVYTATRIQVASTDAAMSGGKVKMINNTNTEEAAIIRVVDANNLIVEQLNHTYLNGDTVVFLGRSNPGLSNGTVLVKNSATITIHGSKNKAETFFNNLLLDFKALWSAVKSLPTNPVTADGLTSMTGDLDLAKHAILNQGLEKLTADPVGDTLFSARVWFDTVLSRFRYYNGTTIESLAKVSELGNPIGYRSGKHLSWVDVATVRIHAGYSCRDDSDSVDIVVPSDLDVSLGTTGALGLPAGETEASATNYYYYLGMGTSGVTGIVSSNPSLALASFPVGYNTYKRRFPGGFHNDGSSNLLKTVFAGNLNFPMALFRAVFGTTAASNPTNVFSGSVTTTNINLSGFLPADSFLPILYCHHYSSSGSTAIQPAGDSSAAIYSESQSFGDGPKEQEKDIVIPVDSTQKIDVVITGSTALVAVHGYYVTEAS